jgi:hypothetical protein
MPSDDKLNEARLEAGEILALPEDDVLKLFHRERKRRKLSRLVGSVQIRTLPVSPAT